MKKALSAEVITCPGRLGDFVYQALQLNIDGFNSPFVLTLALPAVGCRALAQQSDPAQVYKLIAYAINKAKISVEIGEPTLKSAA